MFIVKFILLAYPITVFIDDNNSLMCDVSSYTLCCGYQKNHIASDSSVTQGGWCGLRSNYHITSDFHITQDGWCGLQSITLSPISTSC